MAWLLIADQVAIPGAARRGSRQRTRTIIRIGHRAVACFRHSCRGIGFAVRVRTGTFGDAMPRRDLLFSPDHAVSIDDVLNLIRRLLSGDAIAKIYPDSSETRKTLLRIRLIAIPVPA